MVARLSVNLNAVAQLRNRRNLPWPDIMQIGHIALNAGAAGLTIHPRPDERHIRRTDIAPLASVVLSHPGCEYNIEGYPDLRFLEIVDSVYPDQVTLVPDAPTQATSDHGWDFRKDLYFLKPIISELKDKGIRVSLFSDPDSDMVQAAAETGADCVELFTGAYGLVHDSTDRTQFELDRLEEAAKTAVSLGLRVHAGHDLTLGNVAALVRRIPFIDEVSIGHALTADAIIYGMSGSVQRYRQEINSAISGFPEDISTVPDSPVY